MGPSGNASATPEPPGRGGDRQVRFGRILGLLFCAAGFVTIGFGWNGMAKMACPDCQLPYLLSGGATGLGLILVGGVLLVMAQIRDERRKLADQLRDLGTTMSRAVSAPALAAAPETTVLAGRSTYHRRGCRLIEGKVELDQLAVDVAALMGLTPCRVCDPPRPGGDGATLVVGADAGTAPSEESGGGEQGENR
jgi:hypothetical protein